MLFLLFPLLAFSAGSSLADSFCESQGMKDSIHFAQTVQIHITDRTIADSDPLTQVQALYTAARVEKAQLIFTEVKTRALQLLSGDSSNPFFPLLQKRIENSRLLVSPGEALVKDVLVTNVESNIQLGGWLELIDQTPEAVFLLLAHELGHVVGPTHTFIDHLENHGTRPRILAYNTKYLLDPYVQNAARRARGYDFDCMSAKAEELIQGPLLLQRYGTLLKQTLVDLKTINPYISLTDFASIRTDCAPSQVEETYADIFAGAIVKEKLKTDPSFSTARAFAFFCAMNSQEKATGHIEPDPHPPMASRMEFFLSALRQ